MEKVKKKFSQSFVFKVALLTLPLYILWYLYIGNFADFYNLPTNTRWNFVKQVLKTQNNSQVKTLFLGESRVNAGIDFKKIDSCFSFASGGATSIEMYYILEKYLQKNPAPENIFLSISPRFLTETFSFFPYAVRYDLINSSDFNEITNVYSQCKKDTVLGSFPLFKFYSYQFRFAGHYQTDVYRNKAFGGYSKNTQMKKRMLNSNGGRMHPGLKQTCSELNYETRYKEFQPSKLLDIYFNKILLVCQKHKINLTFDFMPMNESSYKKLSPNFISTYKNYISSYSGKFPEFNISNRVYSYPDSCFGDASHLNNKGKLIFTDSLLQTLNN